MKQICKQITYLFAAKIKLVCKQAYYSRLDMQPTPLRAAIHLETPPSAPTSCSVRVCQTCGWRPRPLAGDFSVTTLRVWPCSPTRSRRQQPTTPTTTTPPTAAAPRTTHHCKRNMTNSKDQIAPFFSGHSFFWLPKFNSL